MLHRLLSMGAAGVMTSILALTAVPTSTSAATPDAEFVPLPFLEEEEGEEEGKIEYWEEEEEEQPAAAGNGKAGADKKKPKTLEEFVADFDTLEEGLFTFYRNKKTGAVFMAIDTDQFDREFIYISTLMDGVVSTGTFRGQYRANNVVKMTRHYDRVEFKIENTDYYFDPENALSRAKDANISPAFVHVEKIKATSEDEGTVLVPVEKLFVSPALDPIKLPFPTPVTLGKLNGKKSKIAEIRTYPQNVDVVTELTFDNPKGIFDNGPGVTDGRYVTVRLQNSLVAMPEEGYTARFDDQRIGYFLTQTTDLTSADRAPYRDLIHRWRLSEDNPIVFWIENTTPEELRPTIKAAAEAWNLSFAKAGFPNAIQVKIQPDDADWDAGDIRYNVLRWTSSPQPPFGGYGPSVVNPRTGEIIAADIMLEYVFVTNRMFLDEIYTQVGGNGSFEALADRFMPHRDPVVEEAVSRVAALGLSGDMAALRTAIAEAEATHKGHTARAHNRFGQHHCDAAFHVNFTTQFGLQVLESRGASEPEKNELLKQGLYFLVLHEIGHTLGLNHNMKSSQLRSLAEVHDKSVTDGVLTGSVMDYPSTNIAPQGTEQGDYINSRPGPYDDWAIEFGYSPAMDDPEARAALLARSTEPELAFGNDADDMRSAGVWGIDPRTMVNDLTSDAVDYSVERFALATDTIADLKERFTKEGETWEALQDAYIISSVGGRFSAIATIANYPGGVQVERFVAGQPGSEDMTPFTPVPVETQKAAVKALRDNVFAPDAMALDGEIIKFLQRQRRGFNFFGITEDPKIHEMALFMQDRALAQMMSPVTMRRITNSRLYGNSYDNLAYLKDLSKAIFEDDAQGNVNTYRQNLQIRYVTRLIVMIILPFYDDVSQSAALANLKEVRRMITPSFFGIGQAPVNAETKAHRDHVKLLLRTVGIL